MKRVLPAQNVHQLADILPQSNGNVAALQGVGRI